MANKIKKVYSTQAIGDILSNMSGNREFDNEPFFNGDVDLRKANIFFEMTKEEAIEYQRCFEDPFYFISTYCQFLTDKGWRKVTLRKYQESVIKKLTEQEYIPELEEFGPKNRNCIWMASRQTGKTTTISGFIAYKIVFSVDKNILLVANKENTSKEILDKVIQIFRRLPFFLKPGCISFGKTEIVLDNGCRVFSSTTANTTSIGYTIHVVLLDEFAHIKPSIVNEFWRSIYPTLSSSKISQCIITSTPNGIDNKFYEIWSKSIRGENSFIHFRTDWWEVPGHDDAWARRIREDFGDAEFEQEFALQFSVTSKVLMNGADLNFLLHIEKKYEPVDFSRISDNPILENQNIRWKPGFDPLDIDGNDRFIFSVDIAEGNDLETGEKKSDESVINIFRIRLASMANLRRYRPNTLDISNCIRFEQVGIWSDKEYDEAYVANMTNALAYDVFDSTDNDNVRIMVEMNFNGNNYVTILQKNDNFSSEMIIKTYHRKPIPGENLKKKMGFRTTQNKEYFCKKACEMVKRRRLVVTDEKTIEQLASFGYVKRSSLGGIAMQDDCAVTVMNIIPRLIGESDFEEWINQWFEDMPPSQAKYNVAQMLEMWEVENPEISDASFNDMVSTAEYANDYSPYNPSTSLNTYSSIIENSGR